MPSDRLLNAGLLAVLGLATACGRTRTPSTPFPADVDQAPERGACPAPVRPVEARHRPGTDTVVAQFLLDTTGHVTAGTMTIVRSTDPRLNQAALATVRGCHYEPARKDGHPVAVIIQQPVMF